MTHPETIEKETEAAMSDYERRRAQEHAEAEAHRLATIKLIEEICEELNKGRIAGAKDWTIKTFDPAEYTDRWPELVHADGRAICFSDGHVWRERRKRLGIGGRWPMHDNQYITPSLVGESHPGIEVSRDRGAAVIAREITRRFLPDYTAIWLKCKARIDATNAHENQTTANYRRLYEVLGVKPTEHLEKNHQINLYNYWGDGYGDITVSGSDVRFDLRGVDIKTAEEIASLLWDIHNRVGAHK